MTRAALALIAMSTLTGVVVSYWSQICAGVVMLVLFAGPVSLGLSIVIGVAGVVGLPLLPRRLSKHQSEASPFSPLGLPYKQRSRQKFARKKSQLLKL